MCGLYIHFPFCKRTCFYCKFRKEAFQPKTAHRYLTALAQEIKLKGSAPSNTLKLIDTVYLGGGSPSLVTEPQLQSLMEAVREQFRPAPDTEITVEMNPEDVTADKLAYFKAAGINRLSIGTQSFVQADLDYLKRTHGARQSLNAVQKARDAGFENINIDFIIGLPSQSETTLSKNLEAASHLDVPHVSAYVLEGMDKSDAQDDQDSDVYHFFRRGLLALGYEHYEISNFSKPGFPSRHNLKYWQDEDYVAVGLAASGYEGGDDYKNHEGFADYFALTEGGKLPIAEVLRPDPTLRRIVTGLRLLKGIPQTNFSAYGEQVDFLVENRMLIRSHGNIAVPPDKLLLLNEILTDFL